MYIAVFPTKLRFLYDVRHKDAESLQKAENVVKSLAERTWAGCACTIQQAWNRDTVYWNKELVDYVEQAAKEAGIKYQYIHSGAGHDAQFAAYMLPTTMFLFSLKVDYPIVNKSILHQSIAQKVLR